MRCTNSTVRVLHDRMKAKSGLNFSMNKNPSKSTLFNASTIELGKLIHACDLLRQPCYTLILLIHPFFGVILLIQTIYTIKYLFLFFFFVPFSQLYIFFLLIKFIFVSIECASMQDKLLKIIYRVFCFVF